MLKKSRIAKALDNAQLDAVQAATTKLEGKKLGYYNNVDEMIQDTNLTVGMSVTTFGYYTANDGGGCFYVVTLASDDMSVELDNGLYATPFFQKTDSVSIKQLGAQSNISTFDNTPLIMLIMNAGYTVYIPVGIWYCSPFALKDNARIVCECVNYRLGLDLGNGISQLVANQDCDVFIDCTNCTKLDVSAVVSAAVYNGAPTWRNIGTMVKLSNTQYSTFDLIINDVTNVGISLQSTWENTFKRLSFRKTRAVGVSLIKTQPILKSGDNISQNVFYDIQAESFGVTVFDTTNGGAFTHNRIISILIECSIAAPFEKVATEPTELIPLLKLKSDGNNIIDNIQINNLQNSVGAKLGDTVYKQSILGVLADSSDSYGFSIGKLVLDYSIVSPIELINQSGNSISFYSYLTIDEIISPTSYEIKCNVEKMKNFRISKITQGSDGNWKKSRRRSISEWYIPVLSPTTYLTYDATSHNTEQCKVHIPTTLTTIGCIHASGGKTIKARINGSADITFSISYTHGDTTTTATATITPDATLSIKDIFALPASTSSRATIVVSASSSADAFIEDLWAE